MDRVAEAVRTVGTARRRLVFSASAHIAARGALVGALVGGAAWLASRWASADAGLWPLAGPVAGAVLGAIVATSRGFAPASAALALDAAAHTDEAFVTALTASDAAPEFRSLTAGYAVERCPRGAVARFLPFRAPAVAATAAVATALLAALVLVPRAAEPEPGLSSANDDVTPLVGGAPGGRTSSSPRDRVEQLRQAVARNDPAAPASLAPDVRKDLGAVTNDDLKRLAEALAAKPESAEAAKRALAALGRGDRAAATDALREAIGGAPSVVSPNGTGTGEAAAAPSPSARRSWAGANWPLRYDRVVRRWLDETAAPEESPK